MTSAGVLDITDGHPPGAQRGPAISASDLADVHIDGWLIEPALNKLTRDGVSVRLRPQLVDLLLCLASRPGKVFPRDELVALVWDGRWIAPSGVSRCIAELRTALADDAHRPHIIETIPKRGYRLVAPVAPAGAADAAHPRAQAARSAAICPGSPASPAVPRALWQWCTRQARRFAAPSGGRA